MFEFLVLESAQAGLSWATVLKKREAYRKAFAGFDAGKVARFSGRDIARLMNDEGIIRNRMKIAAAVNNAKHFLEVKREYGTFSRYMWGFTRGKQIDGKRISSGDLPATSPEAEALAKDMKKRGFSFFGSTICYAHMQAVGMVNDHERGCFRHKEVMKRT